MNFQPLAWAERLDAKSLDNFLASLAAAAEHEPMDEALVRVDEVIRSFHEAVSADIEPESDSFFRPGRTYTRKLPFRAPEDRPNFECVGVGMHPSKGVLRAFGFEQPGDGRPWASSALSEEAWAEGWVELGPARPDRLTRTFAPTQVLSNDDQAEAPTLVIYRAYSGSIPLGTYTNPTAARAHCEDKARLERPTGAFAWISDPNGGGDLVEGEMEHLTGYVVTSLEVDSEYDPEVDG